MSTELIATRRIGRPTQRHPAIDDMIANYVSLRPEDLSLASLARQSGRIRSRQGVARYLQRNGLDKVREERKLELQRYHADLDSYFHAVEQELVSVLQSPVQRLVNSLQARAQYLKSQEDSEDVIKRILDSKKGKIPSDRILKLIRTYDQAVKERRKLSLSQLAEEAEFDNLDPERAVSYWLKRFGRKSMIWDISVKRNSPEQRAAIKHAWDVGYLSETDVARFVKVENYDVRNAFSLIKERDEVERPAARPIKQFGGRQQLTHADASQIYEAVDAGFDVDEITELVGKGMEVVDYALRNRYEGLELESRINNALKTMFPAREIAKPYRTWKV